MESDALHAVIKAIEKGDLSNVRSNLTKYKTLAQLNDENLTEIFCKCVKNRRLSILEWLIKDNGGFIPNPYNVLADAVADNLLDMVKMLLKYCPDRTVLVNHNQSTLLHHAARLQRIHMVKYFLENGWSPNVQNIHGTVPIHHAALYHNAEILQLLLDYKADVNIRGSNGCTALYLAAANCMSQMDKNKILKHKIIRLLLVRGKADPNLTIKTHVTPIFYAVREKSINDIQLYIDHGADLDFISPTTRTSFTEGFSLLHHACTGGNADVVLCLLKGGADSNFGGKSLPLHVAIKNQNEAIVKHLIEYNADCNTIDDSDQSALQLAVTKDNHEIIESILKSPQLDKNLINNRKALYKVLRYNGRAYELFVKYGFHVNAEEAKNPKLFQYAMKCVSNIDDFLVHNIDLNINTEEYYFPLFYAIKENHEIIECILNRGGIDVNTPCIAYRNWTSLIYACNQNYKDVVALLINAGADPNISVEDDDQILSPVLCAIRNRNCQILKILIDNGAKIDPFVHLKKAIEVHGDQVVRLFLNYKIDVDDECYLNYAIDKKNEKIVRLLLKHNAKIDYSNCLHRAIKMGNLSVVSLLLEHITIDTIDSNGDSVLKCAISTGSMKIIKKILNYKPNINCKQNQIAFLYAIQTTMFESGIVNELMNYGFKLKSINFKSNIDVNVDINIDKLLENCITNKHQALFIQFSKTPGIDIKNKPMLLIAAAKNSFMQILQILIKKKYDVNNSRDEYQNTALHFAVKYKKYDAVEFLLKHKANVNVKNYLGELPMHHTTSLKMLNLLMHYKANIYERDYNGRNILHHVSMVNDENIYPLINYLIEKKYFRVNARDNFGSTPLTLALHNNFIQRITNFLINSGGNISSYYNSGDSFLHRAIIDRNLKLINYAMINGFEFNENFFNQLREMEANLPSRRARGVIHDGEYIDMSDERFHRFIDADNYINLERPLVLEANLRRRIEIIIQQQIIKYDCLNMKNDEYGCEHTNGPFTNQVLREIEELKKQRIISGLSLFDILKKSSHDLMNYTRNPKVYTRIRSVDCQKYPNFGQIIMNRFFVARKRRSLEDSCIDVLYKTNNHEIPFKMLPSHCIEKIFSYLNEEDIEKMILEYTTV